MLRPWLDAGADRVRHQTLHRRRDPRVVPRIISSPARRNRGSGLDGGVERLDRTRPLPTPAAASCIERPAAAYSGFFKETFPHPHEYESGWNIQLDEGINNNR